MLLSSESHWVEGDARTAPTFFFNFKNYRPNMRTEIIYRAVIALLGGMLFAGCSSTSQSEVGSVPVFPDLGSAWVADGAIGNAPNLRLVVPGISENQVYLLIHEPHFSDGTFGTHPWNYIFRFRTGRGNEFVTCQYQVQFNEQRLVQAAYWKNPGCALYAGQGVISALVPASP